MYIATKSVNSSGALASETGVEPEMVCGAPLKTMAISWLPAKRLIGKPIISAHIGSGSEFAASKWRCGGSPFRQRLDLGNKVVPEHLAQLAELIGRQVDDDGIAVEECREPTCCPWGQSLVETGHRRPVEVLGHGQVKGRAVPRPVNRSHGIGDLTTRKPGRTRIRKIVYLFRVHI